MFVNIPESIIANELIGVRFRQASSSEMFGRNYDKRLPDNRD